MSMDLSKLSTALLIAMIMVTWSAIIFIVLMDEYQKQKGKDK